MPTAEKTKQPAAEDMRHAVFTASVMPAIGEFMKQTLDYVGDEGFLMRAAGVHEAITINPNNAGGVDIIASRPWSLVVIHDPDGRANKPISFHADDRMIEACRTPSIKRPFDCNGDDIEADLPDWMIPHRIVITTDNSQRPQSADTVSPRPDGMSLIYVEPKGMPADASEELGACLYKSCFPVLHETQTVKHVRTLNYEEILSTKDVGQIEAIRLSSLAYRLIAAFGDYPTMRVNKSGSVIITYADEPHVRLMHAQTRL